MTCSSMKKLARVALIAGAAGALAPCAFASPATYTYTGHQFSYVGTGPDVTHVSGSFTVASALAANSVLQLLPTTFLSLSFTDGRVFWDTSNYFQDNVNDIFSLTTDGDGHIAAWNIVLLNGGPYPTPGFGIISTCTACNIGRASDGTNLYNNYNAYNFNSPGTWTGGSTVAEPSSLALLLVGLAGFRATRKRSGAANARRQAEPCAS